MQYKMIFCDIDGTLLDSANRISQQTIQKIKELYICGIPFILVSARAPSGILPIQKEIGIKAPIVCYSGALIIGLQEKSVKSIAIENERAKIINEFIKKEYPNICLCAYSFDDWISEDTHDERIELERSITGSVPMQAEISDIVMQNKQIHKLLCLGKAKDILGLNKELEEKFKTLSIYRSKDTYLEIMDGTVSKAEAIKYLCKQYGIPIEAAVSFGDNFNDIDMLKVTGASFAMGNAPKEVKRFAKNVTLDNDHDGVLKGLKKLNFE